MRKLLKLIIIVHMSSMLSEDYLCFKAFGGHNKFEVDADKLITEIQPKFKRTVLFETKQNSWYGRVYLDI